MGILIVIIILFVLICALACCKASKEGASKCENCLMYEKCIIDGRRICEEYKKNGI